MEDSLKKNAYLCLEKFFDPQKIKSITLFGSGLINKTFLVTLIENQKEKKLILQKINKYVFKDPPLIMQNIKNAVDHLTVKKSSLNLPILHHTINSNFPFYLDENGDYWRVLTFIPETIVFDKTTDLKIVSEAGAVLARFHQIFLDADLAKFAITIDGFHKTSNYLKTFETTLFSLVNPNNQEESYCQKIIQSRRLECTNLERALSSGELHLSIIHGDPKLNNILFDNKTFVGMAIIDLDTIMPGLPLYDVGDALRSICNRSGEEDHDLSTICFDLHFFETFLSSYFKQGANLINKNFIKYLFDAVWLLPYELGLRFFSDHLQGNLYFKVEYEKQNLHRAQVQFKLMEDILSKKEKIMAIILSEFNKSEKVLVK